MNRLLFLIGCLFFNCNIFGQTVEELSKLAFQYQKDGYEHEAIQYGKDAVEQSKKLYGINDIRYAMSLMNLANIYRDCKKSEYYNIAEEHYRQTFEYFQEQKKYQEHTTEGTLFFNYGVFLENIGKIEDAKIYYIKAHKIYKIRLGEKHPLTLQILKKIQ